MSLTRKQLAILHVAKAKLGWTDAMYRCALVEVAGVTSAKDLDRTGFEAMMGLMEHMGFRPLSASGPDYGARPGMATFAQLELIRTVWREHTRGRAGEAELNKWLARSFGVSSLRFVTLPMARKAITALKAMKARDRAKAA